MDATPGSSASFGDVMGFAAFGLGLCCYVPQMVKTWSCRDVRYVAAAYLAAHSLSNLLYVGYSLWLPSTQLFLSTACSLSLDVLMIWFKWVRPPPPPAPGPPADERDHMLPPAPVDAV